MHLSIPSPAWQGFSIGPVFVHAYALCILTGIVLAMLLTAHRFRRRGIEPGVVIDLALWSVTLGIIGARTWHVLTHWGDYFSSGTFGDMLLRAISINQGGIAIFGALLGGGLGCWIAVRITGLRFWSVADALAPGLLFAQAAGRWGNWFNHELFGAPTTLPWGLRIESTNAAFPVGLPSGTLFHPTFLYESIWDVLGAFLLIWIGHRWRTLQWGRLFACYLIWYGFGRFWLEQLRLDPIGVFLGLRYNAWGALLAIVVGIVVFFVQRRRHPGLEPSGYRPGREPEVEPETEAEPEPEPEPQGSSEASPEESGEKLSDGAATAEDPEPRD